MKRFSVKVASGLVAVLTLIPNLSFGAGSTQYLLNEREISLPANTPSGLTFVNPYLTSKANLWNDFTAKYGNWSVELDPITLTPALAAGQPIKLGVAEKITDENVVVELINFIKANKEVLNVNPDEIRLSRKDFKDDRWYINFKQYKNNYEVLFAGVQFTVFQNGNLTDFRITFYNDLNSVPTPNISYKQAAVAALANDNSLKQRNDQTLAGNNLFLMPIVKENRVDFKLVYKVPVETNEAMYIHDSYVDASNGDLVWKHQLATNVENYKTTGIINHKDGMTVGEEKPMSHQYFTVDGKRFKTDDNGQGQFTISISPSITSTLEGEYAKVACKPSSVELAKSVDQCTPGTPFNFVWDNNNSDQYQRNAYYFAANAHDFWKKLDTTFKFLDIQFLVTMEYTDPSNTNQPNAYSSGDRITYLALNDATTQMPNCPSIFYHEYGHSVNAFFFRSKTGTGMLNAACNEATADVSAVAITNENKIGKGYLVKTASSYIRDMENSRTYPDYMKGESHNDGEILGGAFGDIRKATSNDIMTKLFLKARYGLPDNYNTITSFYLWFNEVLKADDDDGDLTNGTPHAKEIITAFTNHGIGANLTYRQNYVLKPIKAYPGIDTKITLTANPNLLGTMVAYSIIFYYKLYDKTTTPKSGSVKAVLSQDGKEYTATIPALGRGAYVSFYYVIFDKLTGKSIEMYTNVFKKENFVFNIGYTRSSIETFETNSWTVGSSSDNSTMGVWTRGTPTLWNDPTFGVLRLNGNYTQGGKYCYATTMGSPLTSNLFEIPSYVPNGQTTLISPEYTLKSDDCPAIQFKYFYSANPMMINDANGTYGAMPDLIVSWTTDGTTWTFLDNLGPKSTWTNYFKRLNFKTTPFTGKVKFKLTYSCNKDYANRSLSASVVMMDDFEILDTTGVVGVNEDIIANDDFNAYPNPFNGSVSIETSKSTYLQIFNTLGNLVAIIEPNEIFGDKAKFVWNGYNNSGETVAPGIYIIKSAAENSFVGKIIKK